MQAADIRVHVLTGRDAVSDRLRSITPTLVRGPFQKDAFLAAWLTARRDALPDLALATASDAATGDLLFALPMMLTLRSGVPAWTAIDDGVADYNAPLFAPDFHPSPETMREIWERIVAALPRGDLVMIEKMPATLDGRRNPLLDLAGVERSRFDRHPLALDRDPTGRRGSARSLGRKRRKLAREGQLDFVVHSDASAAPLLDRLMAWRDRRYDAQPFAADVYARLLAGSDMVRLGVLRLDGEPIAGCFCIVDDGVLRLLVTAFSSLHANRSPGLLAVDAMIDWARASGLREFDFTIGSEPYKLDFGARTEALWEIRRSLQLRGSVVLRLLAARRLVGRIARRGLPVIAAARAGIEALGGRARLARAGGRSTR